MRYKNMSIMGLLFALSFIVASACGPIDNFQNQRQFNLNNLQLQSSFFADSIFPSYSGNNPPTFVNSNNTIQVTFSENFNLSSLNTGFRLTETYLDTSSGQMVMNDLTSSTTLNGGGNVAIFTFNSTDADQALVVPNAKYELTMFQTVQSMSGQNLRSLVIYKLFSGANFEQSGNTAFTDPTRKPYVIDVNYYEICGQPYMYIFFNEDLQRAPLVRVKTGVIIGTFLGGEPTYATWPAYNGRMDVFGVHINSGGALSGHKIKIFKNDVVDLQGDTMERDYEKGGLFQLISPCP